MLPFICYELRKKFVTDLLGIRIANTLANGSPIKDLNNIFLHV